jgi:hypothetical protein
MKFPMPITILSENDTGDLGEETHECMTQAEAIARCRQLSAEGVWEPIEVQGGESMETLDIRWWGDA